MALLLGPLRPPPAGHTTTYEVFEQLATCGATKDRVALLYDHGSLTYHQLHRQVISLQQWLMRRLSQDQHTANENGLSHGSVKDQDVNSHGIVKESFQGHVKDAPPPPPVHPLANTTTIGVCLPRSPTLVALILAVWKLGWSYVPLDPSVPALRTLYVLRDTRPACVVTDTRTALRIIQLESDTTINPSEHLRVTSSKSKTPDIVEVPVEASLRSSSGSTVVPSAGSQGSHGTQSSGGSTHSVSEVDQSRAKAVQSLPELAPYHLDDHILDIVQWESECWSGKVEGEAGEEGTGEHTVRGGRREETNEETLVGEENEVVDEVRLSGPLSETNCKGNREESGHGSQRNQDRVACIIYTSGSTGHPKGVQLTMGNLMNRLRWQWQELPYLPRREVGLMSKSLTFVDSITELLGPLLWGVPVAVVSEPSVNPELLVQYVAQYGVTRLILVPSLLKLLLLYLNTSKESIKLLQQQVKLWVSSGESLPGWLVNDFFAMFPGSRLVNLYGSTEVTGDVTCYSVEEVNWRAGVKVPVGSPVANTAVLVLHQEAGSWTLADPDQQGQVAVLGDNVSPGYLPGCLSNSSNLSSFVPVSSVLIPDPEKQQLLHHYITRLHDDRGSKHAHSGAVSGASSVSNSCSPPAGVDTADPQKVARTQQQPPDGKVVQPQHNSVSGSPSPPQNVTASSHNVHTATSPLLRPKPAPPSQNKTSSSVPSATTMSSFTKTSTPPPVPPRTTLPSKAINTSMSRDTGATVTVTPDSSSSLRHSSGNSSPRVSPSHSVPRVSPSDSAPRSSPSKTVMMTSPAKAPPPSPSSSSRSTSPSKTQVGVTVGSRRGPTPPAAGTVTWPQQYLDHTLLYLTGDLGRVVAGGQVVLEGRRDGQVKVRGVRVHLAEVEDALHRSGYTAGQCVLAVREGEGAEEDECLLAAFVVLLPQYETRDTPVTQDVARCLKSFLPEAVVPRLVVLQQGLPHLPSGKVDRKALLSLYRRRMSHRGSRGGDSFLILRKEEPIESRVLRIICSTLGVERSQDVLQRNYFELGGTSIDCVGVVVRLRELDLDVTLDAFLKAPTIGDVVNDILKAKTMSEVMNLFCSPCPALPNPPSPHNLSTPARIGEDEGGGGDEEDDECPVPDLGGGAIPALHPDLPVVCPSLHNLSSPRCPTKLKGIRLALLHTLPVSQGVDKQTVIEMVAKSFTSKNPLDVTMKVPAAAHRTLLNALWPRLVQDDLSFVVKDPQRGILGVVINTDFFNEPQVGVPASMEEIAALHAPLEEEGRHQLRQERAGARWVHNLFLATNTSLTPQDNVRLALHLEKELLRMAQTRQYNGVFTVNSNPLNQLLCENYLGYQRKGAVRVCSFVHRGRQPFVTLPHDLLLISMTKKL